MIFRLGKLLQARGPEIFLLTRTVDRMVRVDLRVITIDVAQRERMTRDNVPVSVKAGVSFRVIDSEAVSELLTS